MFETVRSASRSYNTMSESQQFPRLGSMTTSTLSSGSTGPRMSLGPHMRTRTRGIPGVSGFPSLDSTGHSDSEGSFLTDSEEYPYV